ncbi:hypothetical protein SEVIR_9G110600v4 [Setaria viridis]|uniref:Uncharacterized protein n=2 Tax=Setaria TaxID=4554 RepID=K4AFX9_SETIT|nr:uncharacterized protein LOC101767727 [Setaria italica]XP_034576649.1 uncharacterized protein LOC117840276 [Setaria viridis]RCV41148.1 hypothetical protein SETIT_9G112100v2 [Setaria italica]TKV91651.1 hypothetical protein SEVIR_9G110600v2 [Setaria viridis]
MYSYTLRAATSSGGGTGLGFALGRIGGRRGGGGAGAPGLVVPAAGAAARGRSVSATPAAEKPVPGDQGVGMEQPKQQQQPQVPPQDAGAKNKRDDMHKTTGDVMSHSFGEGYSTRSDEEGFGGVYGGTDPVEHHGTEIHPSHPEYDTSQGSEVKEKEKARHLKDDKRAT